MQLSVVIVNYNVKYFLEQVLRSVQKAAKGLQIEVFVVDNNSVDDSVEMVRQKFPSVHLIANQENVGFAVANNQAIRLATGKYVLLLNPDTVVEEDTFEKVVAFMDEHPDAGGLGVKMIDGSGAFLPESKRGFPSPWVAFCKTFGLSKIFPKSELFNHYHLGYLSENETHEIEVLAGAFMLLRRSVLDKIGLLDEAFFMYGEDIDLSYRIIQAGYKNYYFADTTILHYKGESTKRGSLNYVKTFYNAMIIFAKKHFEGEKARIYVFMLQVAIYFRALVTLFFNFFKKSFYPAIDFILIFIGMVFLKDFWAIRFYNNPNYYPDYFIFFNIPLYIFIWIVSIYFSGGYDNRGNLGQLIRGIFVGTVLLAAVYGFLDEHYRTSRILILLGAVWAGISTIGWRVLWHFFRYKNFDFSNQGIKNFIIVGNIEESKRVLTLLREAEIYHKFIGTVLPPNFTKISIDAYFLGNFNQLNEIVQIYKINEIIFCSKDVATNQIMHSMTHIGASVEYKIVPEDSLSIIGSRSKNSTGELYTIDIQFNITQPFHLRNKRFLDFISSLFFIVFLPIVVLFVQNKIGFVKNLFYVFIGNKTWVGYSAESATISNLPAIKPNILNPSDALRQHYISKYTLQNLQLLYAKDYSVYQDIEIIWKGFKLLGRSNK